MGPIETVVVAVWAMLPAYVPNNAAVLFGGGRPIDGGREWNGDRLLGDGKTWRGTAGGTLTGVALAIGLNVLQPRASTVIDIGVPEFPIVAGFTLAGGAMLGDIVASFLKRRSGRERGAAFPVLDQLDFLVGAMVCTFLAVPTWFGETFTLPVLVVVLVATPLLHVGMNVLAYWLGLKNEPW